MTRHPSQKPTTDCELLIIGGGPAGMAAAIAAAGSGVNITVIDDNLSVGGQIWRDGQVIPQAPAARRYRQALARCPNVKVLCGTRVIALAGPGALLLEDAEQGWTQHYDRLILCTGARELLLPFEGWTLPGVTGAGGLQALIKAGLPVAGQRIVIAGSGPLLLAAAATARQRGATVVRVAEQASLARVAAFAAQLVRWPGKAIQALSLMHPGYRTSMQVVAAQGGSQLASVRLKKNGRTVDIDCDRLACGFGLVPNTQLGQLLGCALLPGPGEVLGLSVSPLQETTIPGVYAAGECTGFGGSERALVQGRIAGLAAVGQLAQARSSRAELAHWEAFASQLHRSFDLNPALREMPQAETLVCRCEDVTHARLAACSGWTEAKMHTRCGMGACQGRVCGAAAQFLYGWTPPAPRPPLSPVRLTTLAELPTLD